MSLVMAFAFPAAAAVPVITGLGPMGGVNAGGPAFTLDVAGKNFLSGAVVKWNSTRLTTRFVNASGLTAAVPASLIVTPGTANITVTDSGGTSAPQQFFVNTPLKVATTILAPAYVDAAYSNQLSATGGIAPYTWSLPSGASLPSELELASDGAITGTPKTDDLLYSFSVKVHDSSNPPRTGNARITLPIYPAPSACASGISGNSKLKGTYSLFLEEFDLVNADRAWSVGSFKADGAGHITGGIKDTNGPPYPAEILDTFTGTYSIGADGRGGFSMKTSEGATFAFCFTIDAVTNNVAGGATVIEADTTDHISEGAFYLQTSSSYTLESTKGSWTITLVGRKIDGEGNNDYQSVAGYLNFDGKGNVTAGEFDSSQDKYSSPGMPYNKYEAQVPVTGTYTPASDGRGTITLDVPKGPANFVFYPAGAGQLLLLTTDPGVSPAGNNSVLNGKALLRTATSFTDATLKGTGIFSSFGYVNVGKPDQAPYLELGTLDFDGKGSATVAGYSNKGGSISSGSTKLSYSVDSVGRVTITVPGGGSVPAFYLVGPNQGFGVDDSISVDAYEFSGQVAPTGGFNLADLAGRFAIGSQNVSFKYQPTQTGAVTLAGSGGVTGTYDVDNAGAILTGLMQSGKIAATSTPGVFLYTATGDSNPSLAIYFFNADHALLMNIGSDQSEYPGLSYLSHQ
jgi:hypothetical protein